MTYEQIDAAYDECEAPLHTYMLVECWYSDRTTEWLCYSSAALIYGVDTYVGSEQFEFPQLHGDYWQLRDVAQRLNDDIALTEWAQTQERALLV